MMHSRIVAPLGLAISLAACGGGATTPAPAPAGFPSAPPAALPVSDVDFPDYAERTLRSGARLVVVQNREQPVVSIQLLLPAAGSVGDPAGMAGLASVTASLLDKGTREMTAAEIAEAADFIGARLGAGASSEWSSVSLTVVKDFLDRGLELMSGLVLAPTFPEDQLETEKTRRISALRLNRSQPGILAAETFSEFDRGPTPPSVQIVTMTPYDEELPLNAAFPPQPMTNILADVLMENGIPIEYGPSRWPASATG